MLWDADCRRSLEKMYTEPRTQQAIENWKQQYQAVGLLHAVLENSVIGSLTSDGEHVYLVDELPISPLNIPNAWADPKERSLSPEIDDAVKHNVLQAYVAGNGRMRWKLGGTGAKKNTNDPKGEMNDCHFLGPPLSLGGRLYAIHAKDKELRLAVIQAATGKIDRIVSLAKTGTPLVEDMFRRLHAAHAAYGDGILVCLTNAGAILGVDLRSLTIAWAYIYREDKPPAGKDTAANEDMFRDDSPERMMQLRRANIGRFNDWKNTAPVVVDGKVIFTAPDSTFLHCLVVKDGSLLWKADQKTGDLYLGGVYGGKVLVVGKERCRALNLTDGKEAWSLETGMPSGRGIVADNNYYLPLKSATESRKPEVCIIDVANGKIVGHTRQSKIEAEKDIVPGNLLFFADRLLSQSATHMIAYPELAAHLKRLDDSLTANPRDPAALLERGQLLLDKGDLSKAVEDLRSALANTPAEPVRERARLVLFETLTALLQKDFNAPQKDLKEYEELTKVDSLKTEQGAMEAQRRRGIYYTVVAQGYEQIGKPVEALHAYLDFAAAAPANQLLPVPDDPGVRVAPDAWARGHILALLKRATPEQRKQLEEEIEKRLKK
jgi:outer membrane protein assembly factor BamB